MPPQLAAFLCLAFVLHVLFLERKRTEQVTTAVWIPLVWMFLAGSRFASEWLNIGSSLDAATAYMEGSAVDRNVFTALIAAGLCVLLRRRLWFGRLLTQNKWIWFYFFRALLSIIWSEEPALSLKRLVRGLGNVVMVLVVLTEPNPVAAVRVLLKRLALFTLPLSVIFIKYYPDLGRAYHMGLPMFTGVAQHKNTLGQLCLLTGIYFFWSLLYHPEPRTTVGGRLRIPLELLFLVMIAWLLNMANSATSLACLIVAFGVLGVGRFPAVARAPGRIFLVVFVSVVMLGVLEAVFDLSNIVIASLGRDPDLTTRVPMWKELLALAPNPLLGSGYDIFWVTPAGQMMFERWRVFQAHNGYLELYLSLGVTGLGLLFGGIMSGLIGLYREARTDYAPAVLKLSWVAVTLLYNWTEATFYGVSNMWTLLFLAIFDIRGVAPGVPAAPLRERRPADVQGSPRTLTPRPVKSLHHHVVTFTAEKRLTVGLPQRCSACTKR